MIFGEVFERFVKDSPISVMARAALEHALCPRAVDEIFDQVRQQQYTRTLLFSSVVDLMAAVVCRIRPAIHSAYHARSEGLGVSLKAVYEKLNGTEPPIAAALVRQTAAKLGPVIAAMKGTRPTPLQGYRLRIIDGNHFAGTEHRLKELRTTRAGALPGQALVVLDPQTMLAIDAFGCEDGHAQERSLLGAVLETVRAGEVWIADRGFCTTGFLMGIAAREAHFVIRQHASSLRITSAGRRRACGRVETGAVFEQAACLSAEQGQSLAVRRISVVLDRPTREGETEIHIVTNLPEQEADACVIAEVDRDRWTIEGAFGELAACLDGEVRTLAYPRAALLAFCVALVAYNVLSVVRAALRSVHGPEASDERISTYALAEELAGTYRGMMIAVPEAEWAVFSDLKPKVMGRVLQGLAKRVRLSAFRKGRRGPKKPRPRRQSGAKIKHVSTARILEKRKICT